LLNIIIKIFFASISDIEALKEKKENIRIWFWGNIKYRPIFHNFHPLTARNESITPKAARSTAKKERKEIKILGPDVNRSYYQFEVEGKNIRVGLTSIKGLALKTAEKVIEERKSGEYLSVEDFLCRVSLTKSELLSLIKSGVFDSLEPRRTRQILRYFRGLEDVEGVSDLGPKQKERMLVESLGFDPEGDSLSLFEGKRPALRVKDLKDYVGREVELVVRVVDARQKAVSRGRKYFFLFEDQTGLLEGVGETRCLTFGSPPACYLRGEVRRDGNGRAKIFNCSFLNPY